MNFYTFKKPQAILEGDKDFELAINLDEVTELGKMGGKPFVALKGKPQAFNISEEDYKQLRKKLLFN